MKQYCLAIDIGASSGRHIVGRLENGEIFTEEVYRFPNGVKEEGKHLVWDTEELFSHVLKGIGAAMKKYPIESLAIDTWGVDYMLMRGDRPILPCYAYRDRRTEKSIPAVHARIPFETLYMRTGIQFQPFNTIYQLYDDKERGRLERATDFLMLPEYLTYRLTGMKVHEYTNATTTGLMHGGDYDGRILSALGLPARLFSKPVHAGYDAGILRDSIAREVGGNCRVILCASHDTASAVEGIPMEGNEPYISSGTWSLLGIKTAEPRTDDRSRLANYSNEGGVGYIRFQKNIMGLWIVNRLKEEFCPDKSFARIGEEARESVFTETVDVNDPVFLAPKSMRAAFDSRFSGDGPRTEADYFNCAFLSLARGYRQALDELAAVTQRSFKKLYIVGGGAKSGYLNECTARACGVEVIALPIEATAIGNLKLQFFGGKA